MYWGVFGTRIILLPNKQSQTKLHYLVVFGSRMVLWAGRGAAVAFVLREHLINLEGQSGHLKHEIQVRAKFSTLYHGLFLTIFVISFW